MLKIHNDSMGYAFEFDEEPTSKQGFGRIEIREMDGNGVLRPFVGLIKNYAEITFIEQFYPNGSEPLPSEERNGRGSILLEEMLIRTKDEGVNTIVCYTEKPQMRDFLVKKGFSPAGPSHYFLKDF